MKNIVDISCPNCGAPVIYDIRSRRYECAYCGEKIEIEEVKSQKKGFRDLQKKKMAQSAAKYRLEQAHCSKCGADVIFMEGQAMADCAFCGRALVRKKYLKSANMPELLIPFQITGEEAREQLLGWCRANRNRPEAKALAQKVEECKACYLPYELVRGPVDCKVRRMDGGRTYACGGFIDEVFVNCSSQLDNLLLNGMEPYDLKDLTEFDFAYVAGHQVKVDDIPGKELENRIREEVSAAYTPTVQKTLETKAVSVSTDVSSVVRMPVLLPVYYLVSGDLAAAVNGQTGKVSVRALKESHYYFLPWWFKAVLATVLISACIFGALYLAGFGLKESLIVIIMLAIILFIVTLVAYSDTEHVKIRVERGKKIFTSGGENFKRQDGTLIKKGPAIERQDMEPVFYENLDGKRREVIIRFSTPARMIQMVLLALLVLFLPVIIALFLNGFHFSRINLAGSAVWFCIFVPVIPIYLLKFGRIDMYDRPMFYVVSEDGTRTRYRKKNDGEYDRKGILREVLGLLIQWPICLAVWFGIISFGVMCYLTAGF